MQPGTLGAGPALLAEHLRHRLPAAVAVTHKPPPPLADPVPGPGWQGAPRIYLFIFFPVKLKTQGGT